MGWWPFKRSVHESKVQVRPNLGQGPYSKYFNAFVPRKVNTELMEVLRESIPIVDAAINRLISIDGHVVVEGDNEHLVDKIDDFIKNVPVNGLHSGLQRFDENWTQEAHEQGFGLGEFVTNKQRNGIEELRVADSKFIKFRKGSASTFEILQKSDEDAEYRLLNPNNLLYIGFRNENQNPYGVPLMRSCEFVSEILLTIQQATKNSWERFGDPSFSVIYKTSKKDGNDHKERTEQISKELDTANRAKKEGKSVDFVRAINNNSEINIQVLGADGQVLEMEIPARHMLEQIVAKTGLPPWMLGLHWSTTERLSNQEAEMLLSDSEVRKNPRIILFERLIKTELMLRGETWKKHDWKLKWAGVNLHDIEAQARARFLNAQADWYYIQNAETSNINLDDVHLTLGHPSKGAKQQEFKKHIDGEERPHAWPEIDNLENEYLERLKKEWQSTEQRIMTILGFGDYGKSDEDKFDFSEEQRSMILEAMKEFYGVFDFKDPDSPLWHYYGMAYSFGVLQAATMIGKERPVLDIIKNKEIYQSLVKDGFKYVKNNATKAIEKRILTEMQAHVIAGSNPKEVAGHLKKLFQDKNSDWVRLAQSEMTLAAELAKGDEWKEWDIEKMEFSPAAGACSICQALAGFYDMDKCPLPVRDTHPKCRCCRLPI